MEKWRLKIAYLLKEEPGIGGHFFLWIKRMSVKLQQLKQCDIWHWNRQVDQCSKISACKQNWECFEILICDRDKASEKEGLYYIYSWGKMIPYGKRWNRIFPKYIYTHTHAQSHWMGSQGPDEYTFQFQKIK